ncbi:MAG TPA: NAD(P)/FAD-dependent oxidoreductase [Candidatus Deferrimicrobium sp.]|nr:NAD(P)/FAD-dependent oxidoreductase [Candidatus Deferrimicrobium sp.]
MNSQPATPHVVIVGGGFGGLYAARSLRRAPVQVTLIDKRNFHLFQPLLYQVATGGLSPGNIASPLRAVLKRHRRTRVLLAEVTDIDLARRRVTLHHREEISYDCLIVASGADNDYFGHEEWRHTAPGLKTVEDAVEIRRRILTAFEAAEMETDLQRRRSWLTFVVVGSGATGVELAGALAEIAHYTLRRDFRAINPAEARILLVEGADRVLPAFPPSLSHEARKSLEKLGIEVRSRTKVLQVEPDGVTLETEGRQELIDAGTILWAAGITASPLGRLLVQGNTDLLDDKGRVIVEPDLTLPGHPEVFVIGDLANCSHRAAQPLPMLAPVAMQQGRYVARLIARRLQGKQAKPFHYRDKGTLATIGRAAAVGFFGKLHVSGYTAWLLWLFVHLMYLVEFENRLLVFFQWAWNYFTRNRGARLITGRWPQLPPGHQEK